MSSEPATVRRAELSRAAVAGQADTVRVCFGDHYGILRGRRIRADVYLDERARQGFCDGALVWDIHCVIFEETDFSNYRTGYPDLYVVPEEETLRPCNWATGEWAVLGDCWDEAGERIAVDPRGVLRSVIAKAAPGPVALTLELQAPGVIGTEAAPFIAALSEAADGLGLNCPQVAHDPQREIITATLGADEPLPAADGVLLLRGAARELATRLDLGLTAMAQLEPGGQVTRIAIDLGQSLEDEALARVAELGLLLAPLPAGAHGLTDAGEDAGSFVSAASDASPHLALAAAIAAAAESEAAAAALGSAASPYRGAVERLGACGWAERWFPPLLLHDALALAEREAAIADSAGGPWDRDRYWECG